MGGAESVVRNVDKRTARREHRATFEGAVSRFREKPFAAPRQVNASSSSNSLRVYIRKRPFFPHEHKQGEFDVISCLPGRIVIHDARMQPDMRNMFMNHHDFSFDDVFDDNADNEAVFARSAREIVRSVVAGGHGTVMMYGQTGSGKTFTMSSFYKQAADEIFASRTSQVVSVSFIELLGDKCFDMLNGGSPCRLVSAQDGSVHPHPSVEVTVKDANEMIAIIRMAGKLRATAATGVHDQSSRSHALCRIFLDIEGCDEEGCLTLVDLAGTEHRIDNAEHNVERQKEGAKINASLAALKDCIRATAAGAKFVAFRQNRLTQLLRGCFAGTRPHPTMVIATVSPSSKDTEHSLNTLRHACIMDGQGEGSAKQSAHITGGVITKEALGEIDVTGIARAKAAAKRAGKSPRPSGEQSRPSLSHQTKQSNTARRAGLDRRCVEALPPDLADRLLAGRNGAGGERQRQRIQGPEANAEDAIIDDHGDAQIQDLELEEQLLRGLTPALQEQAEGFQALDDALENLKNVVNEHGLRPSPFPQARRISEDLSSKDVDELEGEEDFLRCPQNRSEIPRTPTLQECVSSPPPILGFPEIDCGKPPMRRCSASNTTDATMEQCVTRIVADIDTAEVAWPKGQELARSPVGTNIVDIDIADFAWPEGCQQLARSPVGANSEDAEIIGKRPESSSEITRSPVDADLIDVTSFGKWPSEKEPALDAVTVEAWPEARHSALARSPVDCAAAEPHLNEQTLKKDQEKAEELFRLFCHKGRDAVTWRKNDLRLINSHCLPKFCGPTAQIDWNHPEIALEQLEILVCGPATCGPVESSQSQERPRRLHGRQPSQQVTMQEQTRSSHQASRSSTASRIPMASAKVAARSPGIGNLRRSSGGTTVRRDANRIRQTSPRIERSSLPNKRSPPRTERSLPDGDLGRLSQPANLGNLEAQVASASASVQNWLEELREQIRRDENAH